MITLTQCKSRSSGADARRCSQHYNPISQGSEPSPLVQVLKAKVACLRCGGHRRMFEHLHLISLLLTRDQNENSNEY